ncbi:hypothetical protein GCM10020218_103330 [Dactylosporangium vinaceum]
MLLQDAGDEVGQRQLHVHGVMLDPAHQRRVEVHVELLTRHSHQSTIDGSDRGDRRAGGWISGLRLAMGVFQADATQAGRWGSSYGGG